MAGYTKLFNAILTSTIWQEPNSVRILWITMLALSDKNGMVEASVPGLADMAKISISDCEAGLTILSRPDKYSRTTENEGRRIAKVDGGFLLLNHRKYREKLSQDERREYDKLKKREYRSKKNLSKSVHNFHDISDKSTVSTHTDTNTPSTPTPESNTNSIKTSLSTKVDQVGVEVMEIFEFWKVQLNHPKAVLDQKRGRAIRARLKEGYSVERIKEAIVGIQRCAHNMGVNDRQEVFDDIELICRTGTHVDRFADTRQGEGVHIFKAKQKVRSYLIGDYSDQK